MEKNVFSGGDNTSLCASGIAPSGEQGMFAFDLQRFAELAPVTVSADGTLTLPDLSTIPSGNTITVKNYAGEECGTIKWSDPSIWLRLSNSGVTRIDATGTNTDCVIHVDFDTQREHVVCTIKNGNDIGSFKLNQLSNFDLGNTVPDIIDRVTLLSWVSPVAAVIGTGAQLCYTGGKKKLCIGGVCDAGKKTSHACGH